MQAKNIFHNYHLSTLYRTILILQKINTMIMLTLNSNTIQNNLLIVKYILSLSLLIHYLSALYHIVF